MPDLALQPSPASTGGRGVARLVVQATLLGGVYALLSTPAAYTSNANTLAAVIWPAPAVAAALLWRVPYRQWGLFLAAVFIAMMYVGKLDELSTGADTAFAVLNVLQVTLYTVLGRRFVSASGDISTTPQLVRYVLLLPMFGTAVIAALGATIGMVTKHTSWTAEWQVMMAGNGLAILVLLPALLAWCPQDAAQQQAQAASLAEGRRWGPTAAGAVGATLALLLVVMSAAGAGFSAEVLRALLALVLVSAAIYGGLRAASLSILAAAIAGIALTLSGHGAYGLPSGTNGVWEFQVDLAGLAMLSFFVAIAVHERQKLNLRLERSRRFETMGFLTGGIAHDFNNVLGAVGGYAELATEREQAGLPVQAALGEVRAAVARGKDLTEQILLAGRRGSRLRETTDLRELVCDAVAIARPLLPPGVQLSVTVPLKPVMAPVHRGQITRALLNLLRNASQAATHQVDIRLTESAQANGQPDRRSADTLVGDEPDEACAWLDVLDDGKGVPAAHVHQLFDPFFTSRTCLGDKGHGTGLGLSIVAGVAADHAGGVAVWSGAGERTCFRLMLPLTENSAAQRPLPDGVMADPPEPLASGELALAAAADRATREHAENLLAELGFEPAGYDSADMNLATPPPAVADARLLLWCGEDLPADAIASLRNTPLIRHLANALPASVMQQGDAATTAVTIHGALDAQALRLAARMATGLCSSAPAYEPVSPLTSPKSINSLTSPTAPDGAPSI